MLRAAPADTRTGAAGAGTDRRGGGRDYIAPVAGSAHAPTPREPGLGRGLVRLARLMRAHWVTGTGASVAAVLGVAATVAVPLLVGESVAAIETPRRRRTGDAGRGDRRAGRRERDPPGVEDAPRPAGQRRARGRPAGAPVRPAPVGRALVPRRPRHGEPDLDRDRRPPPGCDCSSATR